MIRTTHDIYCDCCYKLIEQGDGKQALSYAGRHYAVCHTCLDRFTLRTVTLETGGLLVRIEARDPQDEGAVERAREIEGA